MGRYWRISIDDSATPTLQALAQNYPDFYKRALKSLGWLAQKEIKQGIRSGAPGGVKYKEKIPVPRRRLIDGIFGRRQSSRYPIMGKLVQAVGYDKRYIREGTIIVGWLSKSAVKLGTMMEKGTSYPISSKMRGKFLFGGLKVKKPHVVIPERATYKPIKPIIEKQSVDYLINKINAFIKEPNLRGASKSRRRYRVYS